MKRNAIVLMQGAMSLAFAVTMSAACSSPADAKGGEGAQSGVQGKKYRLANSAEVGEKRVYIELRGGSETVNPTPAETEAYIAKQKREGAAGREYYGAAVPASRLQPALKRIEESFLSPIEGSEKIFTCKSVESGIASWSVPALVWTDGGEKSVELTLKMNSQGIVGTAAELGELKSLWTFLLCTRQFPDREVAVGETWKDKSHIRVGFVEFECKLEEVGKFAGRDAFRVNFRTIPTSETFESFSGYGWYAMNNGQLLEGSLVRSTTQIANEGEVSLVKTGIRLK